MKNNSSTRKFYPIWVVCDVKTRRRSRRDDKMEWNMKDFPHLSHFCSPPTTVQAFYVYVENSETISYSLSYDESHFSAHVRGEYHRYLSLRWLLLSC